MSLIPVSCLELVRNKKFHEKKLNDTKYQLSINKCFYEPVPYKIIIKNYPRGF